MIEKIQALEDSWRELRQDYLESDDGAKARLKHLQGWARDNSLEVWKHLQKKEGTLWYSTDEIENALIEANGDLDKALEKIRQDIYEEDDCDPRSEALTAAERNPSLTRKFNG